MHKATLMPRSHVFRPEIIRNISRQKLNNFIFSFSSNEMTSSCATHFTKWPSKCQLY